MVYWKTYTWMKSVFETIAKEITDKYSVAIYYCEGMDPMEHPIFPESIKIISLRSECLEVTMRVDINPETPFEYIRKIEDMLYEGLKKLEIIKEE